MQNVASNRQRQSSCLIHREKSNETRRIVVQAYQGTRNFRKRVWRQKGFDGSRSRRMLPHLYEGLGPDRPLADTKLVAEEESGVWMNVARGRIQDCCYSHIRQASGLDFSGEQWAEAWIDSNSVTAAAVFVEGFVDDSMVAIKSVIGFSFVGTDQHRLQRAL